jgi:hypothetical protein
VSSREFLCATCGALRRAPARYRKDDTRLCHGREMLTLDFVRGEAASRLSPGARVEWLAAGMHVLRSPGRKTWRPATNARQIAEAKRQVAAFKEASRAQASTPTRVGRLRP